MTHAISIFAENPPLAPDRTATVEQTKATLAESISQVPTGALAGASTSEHKDHDGVGIYPLTSSQREIWFDQALYEHSSMYNIGGYCRITGAVDPERFEQA